MREILFRGKRIDNGEWVEGYYAAEPYMKNTYNYGYILENEKDLFAKEDWFVDSRTVGQYTGLTDKNGKKIFEGDIVIDPDFPETKYTVEFFEGAFVAKNDNREIFYLRDFLVFGESEIEVIGNIHDNPELLGGDKK